MFVYICFPGINWYYENYHKALLMKRIKLNENVLLYYAWFTFDILGLLDHNTFGEKHALSSFRFYFNIARCPLSVKGSILGNRAPVLRKLSTY